jgi:hypothetical protein
MNSLDSVLPETLLTSAAREWNAQDCRVVRNYVRELNGPLKGLLAQQTAWTAHQFTAPGGRKCLVAWVAELRQQLSLPAEEPNLTVASAFDSVAGRLGLWQAVALVRAECGALK